jgi:homeobox protein ESX1
MTKSWSTRVSFTQEVMLPPLPLDPDLPPPPPSLPPLSLPPLADRPPLPPELVPALPPLEAPPDPPPSSPPPEPQATMTETIPSADASEKERSIMST